MRMAAQPPQPQGQPHAARSTMPLAALPPDALHTVLRCLSAVDLTTLACVGRPLRAAASDETLWRRLYYARWGTFSGGEDKIMGASFWKVWPCPQTPVRLQIAHTDCFSGAPAARGQRKSFATRTDVEAVACGYTSSLRS